MIDEKAVAAQSTLLQLLVISFMFPLGIGIATSTLVGNALGAGEVALAKELAYMALTVMLCVSTLCICPILYGWGHFFMTLFTSDEDVLSICRSTLKYVILSALVDGIQGVCSGILRGAGKQHIGAITNIVAFYFLGLPCAWWLCFRMNYGVHGLMGGILLGSSSQSLVLLYFVVVKDTYVFSRIDFSCGQETSALPSTAPLSTTYHESGSAAYTISSAAGALAPNHMLIRGV